MNFYPFHIGDYKSHTSHLTPLEDIAYRRLLDVYYQTEKALPLDGEACARLISMRENVEIVKSVLSEFFEEAPSGWVSTRCEAEINRYKEKLSKAQASGKASGAVRKANSERMLNERSTNVQRPLNECSTDAERTFNERSTNVELTKNQEAPNEPPESPASNDALSDPKREFFIRGVKLLTGAGKSETAARTLLGKLAGKKEPSECLSIVIYAEGSINPEAYIAAAMNPKPDKHGYVSGKGHTRVAQ